MSSNYLCKRGCALGISTIGETFRPKVEEVMTWVVNSPFLSQYDHPAKCILFQEVLHVKMADGGSVKDVVALWCDGHGARDPSWDNLLICLEESCNDGLQRVAHFLRVKLIGMPVCCQWILCWFDVDNMYIGTVIYSSTSSERPPL